MYKKKLLILMVASVLPFSAIINAEDTVDDSSGGASSIESEVVEVEEKVEREEPQAVVSDEVVDEETAAAGQEGAIGQNEAVLSSQDDRVDGTEPQSEAAAENDQQDTHAQRWQERESKYRALRQRAEEVGVMLPENPPWRSSQMTSFRPSWGERREHHQQMMNMSPEERDAYRMARYQEMRERAQESGVEMPGTPPWMARRQVMEDEWAKHQAIIEGMTDEERTACHAMHRRHMGMGRGHGMGCGGAHACQGPYGRSGGMPNYEGYPGYGYWPGAPYGQGDFWNPHY
jgi:hypothetical protein